MPGAMTHAGVSSAREACAPLRRPVASAGRSSSAVAKATPLGRVRASG